ncbi:FAD-dependent monooxygenase [Nonomuraea jabiensis]
MALGYRSGRLFPAGDAVHVHPPTGGLPQRRRAGATVWPPVDLESTLG